MVLYSYVLDHDYGFAPNPFFGVCTLATCKPQIRARAAVGDYVMGTGCAKRRRSGRLVFMMRVDEITTYDTYWAEERFRRKRPTLDRATAHAFGDNIYHRNDDGVWQQENSFHSLPDGQPNPLNRDHDTHSDRVLVGQEFVYFGGSGPLIPDCFRNWEGKDICAGRAYKRHFPTEMVDAVIAWGMGHGLGRRGEPADWSRLPAGAR
jgi:hypothetical protein